MCIYCQRITKGKTVNTKHKLLKKSTYETFLNYINTKSALDDPDFTNVSLRLRGCTKEKLNASNATWHRDCYLHVIRDLNRDEGRQKRAIISQDPSVVTNRKRSRPSLIESKDTQYQDDGPPITRSKTIPFDKTRCIFCSPITPLDTPLEDPHLYRCCTSNPGYRKQ